MVRTLQPDTGEKVGLAIKGEGGQLMERGYVELLLTGRYAPEAILKRANLVTEVTEVKHYFQRGIQARDGIER